VKRKKWAKGLRKWPITSAKVPLMPKTSARKGGRKGRGFQESGKKQGKGTRETMMNETRDLRTSSSSHLGNSKKKKEKDKWRRELETCGKSEVEANGTDRRFMKGKRVKKEDLKLAEELWRVRLRGAISEMSWTSQNYLWIQRSKEKEKKL